MFIEEVGSNSTKIDEDEQHFPCKEYFSIITRKQMKM